MPQLILSSMLGDEQTLNLTEFKVKSHIPVQYRLLPWESALFELMNIALQSQGPDVSQIGSTWLGSLTGMVSLRMFRDAEIDMFGGKNAFLSSSWESSVLLGVDDIYSIPWLTDVRVVAYRRDLLEKARIDEKTAFQNAEAFENTLERLQYSGIQIPLAMSTVDDILSSIISWIWGAGGTIRTQDHRHLTLTDSNTLAGIKQYYQLHRYFAPEAKNLNLEQSSSLLTQGKAAVAITSYTNLWKLFNKGLSVVDMDTIALSPVPGVPLIGGSNLVIWLHSFQEDSAVKLIQHLVSVETQKNIFLKTGELPVRAELYSTKHFLTDRFLQTVVLSLKRGKVFQSSRKWAIIETRLYPALYGMWSALFEDANINLEKEIGIRFAGVQKSIEQALLRTHPLI